MVQTLILAWLTRRFLGVKPLDGPTLRGMIMVVLAAAIMTLAVSGVLLAWERLIPGTELAAHPWIASVSLLGAATATGIITFAGASYFLKLPELKWLIERAPKGSDGKPIEISFD